MSYNDPVNKVDPLGLRPGEGSFDVCMEDPRLPSAGALSGSPYRLSPPAAMAERKLQVANCVKGEQNGGFDRTPGSEESVCAKGIFTGVVTGLEIGKACLAARYWAPLAIESSFGPGIDDVVGNLNAMRHFVWSALIAYEAGKASALFATGAHEVAGTSCPGTTRECSWDAAADRHNNEEGATYGDSIRGRYGARDTCLLGDTMCRDYHGNQLVNDVVSTGYSRISSGALDLRGGCPSSSRKVPQGC